MQSVVYHSVANFLFFQKYFFMILPVRVATAAESDVASCRTYPTLALKGLIKQLFRKCAVKVLNR